MKAKEFLSESSTLASLGVDPELISVAHKDHGVSHNEEYQEVKSKAALKEFLKNGHIVVAISDNSAIITRRRPHQIYVNRPDNIMYTLAFSDGQSIRTANLSDAMVAIGKAKYYASVEGHYELTPPAVRQQEKEKGEGDEAVSGAYSSILEIYKPLIKKAAAAAIARIKRKLASGITKMPSYQMSGYKEALITLESIKKDGYPTSRWSTFGRWYEEFLNDRGELDHGWGSALNNQASMREIVKEPLFKQKFVKFVLEYIRKIEERM
jgi:hypothetical protein